MNDELLKAQVRNLDDYELSKLLDFYLWNLDEPIPREILIEVSTRFNSLADSLNELENSL